jgi:nicotinamidase/pyrazinamidase
MELDTDSYSGFRNNWNAAGQRPPTGLAGYLRERGIHTLFCCGLARDVCVKWTAEDAAELHFETFFIWDLTRAVDPANDDRVRADLEAKGVRIVSADRLAPQ